MNDLETVRQDRKAEAELDRERASELWHRLDDAGMKPAMMPKDETYVVEVPVGSISNVTELQLIVDLSRRFDVPIRGGICDLRFGGGK